MGCILLLEAPSVNQCEPSVTAHTHFLTHAKVSCILLYVSVCVNVFVKVCV